MTDTAQELLEHDIRSEDFDSFRYLLEQKYFVSPPGYLSTKAGEVDLQHHLIGRLNHDRKVFVPWLASFLPLKDANILEIGCGTGSSTVAMAEKGASVIALDIHEPSLSVAEKRCAIYKQKATFRAENANALVAEEIAKADAVIFFASIEHMTLDEKLNAFANVWQHLRAGKFLIVVETPNRLWWYDYHSALMPFYLWLPDDLAIHYAKYSKRYPFNESFSPPVNSEKLTNLSRFGRAASYHEFELALGSLDRLKVLSMNAWLRRPIRKKIRWIIKEALVERLLSHAGPAISSAFYERELNLAIQKPV